MSRVRGKDTGPERLVRSELHRRGLRFKKHVRGLPGRPDIVFTKAHVAVFIDGDFWHGYRFPNWQDSLSPFWRKKISETRRRDQRNFAKLRRMGWRVVRLWEHSVERDFEGVIARVSEALKDDRTTAPLRPHVAPF